MTLLRPALVAGLLTFALVSPCAAQKSIATNVPKQINIPLYELQTPYGQRTDAFRRLLFELQFQPRRNFGELQPNPSESLLIVLGEPGFLSKNNFTQGLRSFVQRGGAVLIATDVATEGEARRIVSDLAGVRVTGETLLCTRPSAAAIYGNSNYCPIVQPAVTSSAVFDALAAVVDVSGPPDLFHDPRPGQLAALRVAANAPSRLRMTGLWLPGGIHRLATLSRFCEEETRASRSGGGFPRQPEKNLESLFAVGGTLGKGRVLVLADHSIFINRMILPRDNRNLEFAANCLHWLRGGVSTPRELLRAANDPQTAEKLIGRRDKVLFCDDGHIWTDFAVPLKKVPIKPSLDMAPAVVAAIDQAVGRMEDGDVFNRTLEMQIEGLPGGWPRVLRSAVYSLTVAAMVLLGYLFLWRGRHRHEASVPLLAHAVSQHESGASLLEQRRRAMLRSGNVWETAHQLARQCFEEAGIPLTSDVPPRLITPSGWRQRRRVTRLWKLARGDTPVRISPAALNRWLRDLEELKTALANGTIQLT
ncbi:MAG TPA: DUF4350 domain-containing protein [Gemmataceae bacterium]|jgi:hypothetical protein